MRYILLLLIIVPAIEIAVLLLSGKTLGIWVTIALIILTGVFGAYLAKSQGLETMRRAQRDMQFGQVPGEAILDGICIFVGGVLILTPGFITDATGFLLLIPGTRKMLKVPLKKAIEKWINRGNVTIIR